MAEIQEVKDYIDKLPRNEYFKKLSDAKQEAYIFDAREMLQSYYKHKQEEADEPRPIAKQALYMHEGDSEEYNRLKAHGVTRASSHDTSVTLDESVIGNLISPDVSAILGEPDIPTSSHSRYKGRVGRLI